MNIRIATRGSRLALWQACFTKDKLEKHGHQVNLVIISTKGDRTQEWNLSFDKMEGKGFFTKEIEDALVNGEADLAVHSCKDMPTENAPGLTIAAYSYRANPSDVLLIRRESADNSASLLPLKKNAVTGTSSARRKAQLLSLRPDLEIQDLRGNVPTRIDKLRSGQYDAIVLAAAGLERLELDTSDLVVIPLDPPMFIPAPAQGVLAYQIREEDTEMQGICRLLHDDAAYQAIQLERDVLHAFKGGCQIPLGVFATNENDEIHLWVAKSSGWNQPVFRQHLKFQGVIPSPEEIVSHFNSIKPSKVFISRDESENDYFSRTLIKGGFSVDARSLIEIKGIPFEMPSDAEWLFFTSKNGVKHFFSQNPDLPEKIKIGAIHKGTADLILQMGYNVHFTGQHSDTSITAMEFASIAKGNVVLPQAVNTRGAMEQYLSNPLSLSVYNNQPAGDVLKTDASILVFSSPMNVNSYFSRHTLEDGQLLVAIGPSTKDAIHQLGFTCSVAHQPFPWCLVDEVMTLAVH
jgi:hydroxymethylbilane synthase